MVSVRRLKAEDGDLAEIVDALNGEGWDEANDLRPFSVESLRSFLKDDHHIYLVAMNDDALVGAAHAYIMLHPTCVKYMYVDEVDVKTNYRRQEIGSQLMNELFRLAAERGASEAWLGADQGNEAARAFYRKLGPSEIEPGEIFTFKVPKV